MYTGAEGSASNSRPWNKAKAPIGKGRYSGRPVAKASSSKSGTSTTASAGVVRRAGKSIAKDGASKAAKHFAEQWAEKQMLRRPKVVKPSPKASLPQLQAPRVRTSEGGAGTVPRRLVPTPKAKGKALLDATAEFFAALAGADRTTEEEYLGQDAEAASSSLGKLVEVQPKPADGGRCSTSRSRGGSSRSRSRSTSIVYGRSPTPTPSPKRRATRSSSESSDSSDSTSL